MRVSFVHGASTLARIVADKNNPPVDVLQGVSFVVRAMIVLQSSASNVGARLLPPGHPRGAPERLHFAGLSRLGNASAGGRR